MINFLDLENEINKNKIHNFYIFCGFNENLIKKNIIKLSNKVVSKEFIDLNYCEYDGNTVQYDEILNACETLPFMSDKKVVVVYRADFLSDRTKNVNKNGNEIIKMLKDYAHNIPNQCILIMYYVYDNDRDKVSSKVKGFDKKACVVEFTKLKGAMLERKVKEMFDERKKVINKAELSFFCSEVENNMDIIKNEIDKLCDYVGERDIERKDILEVTIKKSDNDIFNLVDFLSQKKTELAINILDELMFRGEKSTAILSMIERQFNIMLNLKLGMEKGKGKEELSREFHIHPYVCEKMMMQCRNYTLKQLVKSEEICIETEKELKSQGSDDKIKMELLLIKTAMV
jgi:DNA polymerase-3 subunit delta